MDITFADKKLGKLGNDDRKLAKEFGKIRAQKITLRLQQLRDATTLEDVRNLAGKYHELRNERKGEWACDLDQPYRLVFTPHERPIPVNAHGEFSWAEIRGVEIIEVVDYH